MNRAVVQACAMHGWSEMLPDFGVDCHDAMTAAGLSDTPAETPICGISLKSFVQMAEYAGEHAQHPGASWRIGTRYDLSSMGPVGDAALAARTLGAALQRLADHFELLQDSTSLKLRINGDHATLSYRILDPDIWPRYHDALFSLGIMQQVIALAVKPEADAMELALEGERRNTGLTADFAQIQFGGEDNALTFPTQWLDAPMPAASAAFDMRTISRNIAERRRALPASSRLSAMIYARLPEGAINQECLAQEIGMSSRTMRRRLADEQWTFQNLLDECRMRQALLEFRTNPEMSISEIALRLGYAEHSNFTRAFTRWAGMPPHKFRQQQADNWH